MTRPAASRRPLAPLAALAVAAAAGLGACGGGDGGPKPVASVRFAAESDTLSAGITRAYAAGTFDAGGGALAGRAVSYTSSDPSRARVSAAGAVTGVAPGAVTITATSEGRSAALTLDIRPAPPARIALAGVDSALVGDEGQLAATVFDATNAENASFPVALASSEPLVATVDAAGRVTAVGPGRTTLTASVTAPSGQVITTSTPYVVLPPIATLQVLPLEVDQAPGASTALVPVARDAQGNRLARRVTLTTTNPGVATVGGAAGGGGGAAAGQALLASVAAGEATVTATTNFRGRDVRTATVPVRVAPVGPGGFRVEVRYAASVNSAYAEVFDRAAAFWQTVITEALPPELLEVAPDDCGAGDPALRTTTTGLVIFVRVDSIDGPGKVLGSAGPCFVRGTLAEPGLPIYGTMRFDSADVGGYVRSGAAYDVIRHEMGHVLGIGTLWNFGGRRLRAGAGTSSVGYVGAGGAEGSITLGFTGPGAAAVVEDQGGPGTANVHWREAVYGNELMTGFINRGANPASRLTVLSLRDLGYAVNPAAAEAFLPAGVAAAASRGALAARLAGEDGEALTDVALPPLYVNVPGGRPRRLATPASPLR